jgi:hypothetical protein
MRAIVEEQSMITETCVIGIEGILLYARMPLTTAVLISMIEL